VEGSQNSIAFAFVVGALTEGDVCREDLLVFEVSSDAGAAYVVLGTSVGVDVEGAIIIDRVTCWCCGWGGGRFGCGGLRNR